MVRGTFRRRLERCPWNWPCKRPYTDASLDGASYGLGLERLAGMKHGIDDVRKLWQPPYLK